LAEQTINLGSRPDDGGTRDISATSPITHQCTTTPVSGTVGK